MAPPHLDDFRKGKSSENLVSRPRILAEQFLPCLVSHLFALHAERERKQNVKQPIFCVSFVAETAPRATKSEQLSSCSHTHVAKRDFEFSSKRLCVSQPFSGRAEPVSHIIPATANFFRSPVVCESKFRHRQSVEQK